MLASIVSSSHFAKDLETNLVVPLYHGDRRIFLALYKPNPKDKIEKQRGAIRTLAGKIVAALKGASIEHGHVLFSNSIETDLAGLCVNSLILSNYVFNIKRDNKTGFTPDLPAYHFKVKQIGYSRSGDDSFAANPST